MNNIETQIRNLKNEEEPYVGMPLIGMANYGDHDRCKSPMQEYKKPSHIPPGCVESACSGVDSCPLAMAYVPWQRWCKIYKPANGWRRGTIFSELDLPFLGGGE